MYKPTTEELDLMIHIMEEERPELAQELSKEAQEWLVAIIRLTGTLLHVERKEAQK